MHLALMQVTFDLPETLASRLPREPGEIAEIFERGLRGTWGAGAGIGHEVLEFLASGPSPSALLRYKPSRALVERTRVLLEKNSRGTLTGEEAAELDELGQLDTFISLLKAEARKQIPQPA
jgi:hypothetical protein